MNLPFKARIIHLAPISLTLMFSVFCTYFFLFSSTPIYSITPFTEDPLGILGNAIYFVILACSGATMFFILLKKKSIRLITFLTSFAFITAFFTLSLIYTSAFLSIASSPRFDILLLLSLLITLLCCLTFFKVKGKAGDLTVLMTGGALGAFLGVSIPTLSAVLILCFLAVYDMFAVYRGPVGKIAQNGIERLKGLSVSFRDVQVGLGDLTFYSMLVGHVFYNYGILPCIASMVGILLGCFLSFKMLEKNGIFPGLPLPIFAGLAAVLISVLA
ncbi:MAG: presenilin family intramembrane aspartyl protease [Candidatus Bathyarchaeia archaeon]